jgi:hypothetical protein
MPFLHRAAAARNTGDRHVPYRLLDSGAAGSAPTAARQAAGGKRVMAAGPRATR